MLRNALTPAYSKSLGPSSPLRRPQPGRPRSLCRLLHPLPHPQSQAAEVCYSVRSLHCVSLIWNLHSSSTPSLLHASHTSALPRFPSPSPVSLARLSTSHSSHVAAARRWCAHSRIHSIIDIVALPGRARHATIRSRTLRHWDGPPDHKLKACPSRQAARPLRCTAPLAPSPKPVRL
jgi:hypothetical protein